ncbi:MAG TPA: hypothetical protein DF712_22930 [Balneola sp.]|jgi:hypothetical protein|nr:hypothetical protein [Balneola sp.]|tara:strand:+ start:896 stop:1138 length:243 start_codon:yes stop_codon:yes gene_type:complete
MNLEEEENNEFSLPTEMVDNLYELSGGSDRYKGVIMAVSSENGKPLVYSKFDCGMTELALVKTLEDYLRDMQDERGTEAQ